MERIEVCSKCGRETFNGFCPMHGNVDVLYKELGGFMSDELRDPNKYDLAVEKTRSSLSKENHKESIIRIIEDDVRFIKNIPTTSVVLPECIIRTIAENPGVAFPFEALLYMFERDKLDSYLEEKHGI